MKDNLPFFSHDNDARNHAKMKALRVRFGWQGYGQFWALNEMIAGSQWAKLDLNRKVVKVSVASELGMTTDALDDFLTYLSDADECGLINYKDGCVTTDRTQEDLVTAMSKRQQKSIAGRVSAEKRRENTNKSSSLFNDRSTAVEQPCNRDSTPVNREDKRREEESINTTPLPPSQPDQTTEPRADKPPNRKTFVQPTLDEVKAYCQERRNSVDPEQWLDHYTANGWKVGKSPMSDWRAAVRTWERSRDGPARKLPARICRTLGCGHELPGSMSYCAKCGADYVPRVRTA
jgi:hypothetical protein